MHFGEIRRNPKLSRARISAAAVAAALLGCAGTSLAQPGPSLTPAHDAAWNRTLERSSAFPAPAVAPRMESTHRFESNGYRVAQEEGPRLPPPVVLEDASGFQSRPLNAPIPNAETFSAPVWTLDGLENLALERNPAVGEASARVEAARGRWIQAGLPPNLVVGYSASEVGNDGYGGQQGIYLEQEFVRGGKLTLAQRVAAQEWSQARCELEAMRWRVLTDVRRAFYSYRIAVRRYDVADRLIEVSRRSAELTQKLVDSGELRGLEALQTETDLARSEVSRQRFAIAVETRRRGLEAVVGAPLAADATIAGELTVPPKISWDETLARIEAENPLVTAASAAVERAGWAIQYERAQVVPNVNAQVQVQHDFSTDFDVVGIQLSGPIPIWNQNQGSIRRAESEYREAQQARERLRLSLAQSLAAEYRQYESARILVDRYESEVLPKTERTIDLARQALAAREASFLELLTAQRTYFQTTLEYLDAMEEMWVAYARIDGFLLDDSLNAGR